jgi:hypothetical protein
MYVVVLVLEEGSRDVSREYSKVIRSRSSKERVCLCTVDWRLLRLCSVIIVGVAVDSWWCFVRIPSYFAGENETCTVQTLNKGKDYILYIMSTVRWYMMLQESI